MNNISFLIKTGEKIAIVGRNGSGKTTLARLLLRLYDLEKGELKYNKVSVKYLNLEEYRNKYSVVLQDYKLFSASIGENVLGDRYSPQQDKGFVTENLKKAGLFEKFYTEDLTYENQLTRLFDPEGVVLSGGEEQKMALARAFAKNGELIIFDEPSSSLDAISESLFYKTMFDSIEDKTVIMITHRLAVTRMADRILYIENGRIEEEGSHDELIKQNGKYAKMFSLQAAKYRED